MSERDDKSIDHELSGVAMAATHEHEQSVSGNETEAALGAVRSRIAAGDLGGVPPSIDLARSRRRRSPLILLGAVAAVIGMIALGLVAVVGGRPTNDVITPATVPETPGPITAPPSIEPTTTEVEPEPSTTPEPGPVVTAPEAFVEQTISVDAANPPPLVEPTVWRSVPIDASNVEASADVAVGDQTVVVKQKDVRSLTVLDREGDGRRDVVIEEDIFSITAGPFGSVYGLGSPVFAGDDQAAPRAFRFVGISLSDGGPAAAGQVFAAVEVDTFRFLELPPYPFGTGDSGVIDRTRNVGETVIEFSEGRDGQVGSLGVPVPRFAENDLGFPDPETGRIVIPDRGWAWNLDITRDPSNASTYVGPSAPAPTTGDRVVYFDRIGADLAPDQDFGPYAMPVIAILDPDGSGRWIRLPDDWSVVASDVWGTVLMRTTSTDFEFALLDDVLPAEPIGAETDDAAPTSAIVQPTAIERTCVNDGPCTSLATTEDGRLVALDPIDRRLRVFDPTGQELLAQAPLDVTALGDALPWLVTVGPDDVAYLGYSTPGVQDPSNDLAAVPLPRVDSDAVLVPVMVWTGLDGTGDSTLIARKAGLTVVPCCGGVGTRPAPDATVYRWVDRGGEVVESTQPSFDLNLGDMGNSLTRIDTVENGSAEFTTFSLPTAYQSPRDFPYVRPTDDGGAVAYDYVQLFRGSGVFVDFDTDWPENGIDNSDVVYGDPDGFISPALIEHDGHLVVGADDGFERVTLDQVGARGWDGEIEIDRTEEAHVIDAPGLNHHVKAEQPLWARYAHLYAFQLKQFIGLNERVQVDYDEASTTITITTTGFLDDSVAGERWSIDVEIGDDGLFRFVSGSSAFNCQPGRGHQDYSLELCI